MAAAPAIKTKPGWCRILLATLLVYLLSVWVFWYLLPTQSRLTFSTDPSLNFAGFSPDSNLLATTTKLKEPLKDNKVFEMPVYGGPVRIHDIQTGNERFQLAQDWQSVSHVVFSPDSKWIATLAQDGEAAVWNGQTGKMHFRFKTCPQGARGYGYESDMRFAPDGVTLVLVSPNENDLEIWDIPSGQPRATIPNVRCFGLSPDGKTLISAEYFAKPVSYWNGVLFDYLFAAGTYLPLLPREILSQLQSIHVRDLPTGKIRSKLHGWIRASASVAISHDSNMVAIGTHAFPTAPDEFDKNHAEVRQWNLSTLDVLPTLKIYKPSFRGVFRLNYSHNNQILFTHDGVVSQAWNATKTPPVQIDVSVLDVSPDGRRAAFERTDNPANPVFPNTLKNHVVIVDLPSGAEIQKLKVDRPTLSVNPLKFSPDGTLLAVKVIYHQDEDGVIQKYLRTLQFLFKANGNRGIGDPHSEIRFFDVATGRSRGAIHDQLRSYGISYTADSSICYIYGSDGIQLWDVPPRSPWVRVLSFAAIPSVLILLIQLISSRRRSVSSYREVPQG
ncbi:MAG: hypothetical protein JNJ77_09290 [Planctomycetia bacterium]|nr:hypothetical protein [Planctomycetia bacterium]